MCKEINEQRAEACRRPHPPNRVKRRQCATTDRVLYSTASSASVFVSVHTRYRYQIHDSLSLLHDFSREQTLIQLSNIKSRYRLPYVLILGRCLHCHTAGIYLSFRRATEILAVRQHMCMHVVTSELTPLLYLPLSTLAHSALATRTHVCKSYLAYTMHARAVMIGPLESTVTCQSPLGSQG
jgi:hypothetical protein